MAITPENVRKHFFRILKIDFGIQQDQPKSVPIKTLRAALRKVDVQYQSETTKKMARIELRDIYKLAGGRVSSNGNIRFDF